MRTNEEIIITHPTKSLHTDQHTHTRARGWMDVTPAAQNLSTSVRDV